MFRGLLAIALGIVTLLGLETIWRLAGHQPWDPPVYDIRVEPGGKMFDRDPVLGYRLLPGRYRVTLHTGYDYTATHDDARQRITAPLDHSDAASGSSGQPGVADGGDSSDAADSDRPEVWIFGCSFAYGYSVDDEQSVPWLLQRRLPHYQMRNFGVPGYGTVHALLQLRQELEAGARPQAAIVMYFADHDQRNTFSRGRRKILYTFNRLGPMGQPYASLDAGGKLELHFDDVLYREFPLMRRSAVAHTLEEAYNELAARRASSHDVSKALIRDFADLALAHGVTPVVAVFSPLPLARDMLQYCVEQQIPAADIAFDWDLPLYWNAPADPFHPSPVGYWLLAERLDEYLKLQLWLDDYRRLAAAGSDWCEVNEALGRAALAQGRIDAAQEHFDRALEQAPRQPLVHYYRGLAHLAAGRTEQAIDDFRSEATITPDHFETHAQLAATSAAAGRRDEAIASYEQALALRPPWATGHNNLAGLLMTAGRYAEAIAALERALELDPQFFEAKAQLAASLVKVGQPAAAIARYREALELKPDFNAGRLELAWLLATHPDPQVRRGPEALEQARIACDQTAYRDPRALEVLAAAAAENGDLASAIRWQSDAVARRSHDDPRRITAESRLATYQSGLPLRE